MMQTEEKTMESTMEMPMADSNSDDEMNATTKKSNDMPECAIIGLIKNHMIEIDDNLMMAKLDFAEAALDKENWAGKYDKELKCKVLEGQMKILSQLQNDFECMFTPTVKS